MILVFFGIRVAGFPNRYPQRNAAQIKRFAQIVHQIAQISVRQPFGVARKNIKRRRPGLGLRNIAQFYPALVFSQRRRIIVNHVGKPFVQRRGWNTRIPTAPLNKWFADMIDNYPPPLGKNKRRIKLRYITQAKTRPPAFYIFSSNPEGLPDAYLRYLMNNLRETFNLGGIPLRVTVRKTGNPYAEKDKYHSK